ncbi:pseudouridine-5'-phosphatase isoform X1 [Leptopilina boulardi]|uniref:pseudouridine-5'-phosphatase isoform X1 n=1 Tax=Leptopilina boulardi TaxID=63433 RepID=UPI0021F5B00E|nr:pseudouridine-5'-phosphatase isoform X1 [Leptopilina boulardi]
MACNYKHVTHCIFDMDGLLLDTERLYTEAFNRITNAHGKQFTWEHKAQTMGFKTREVSLWTIEHLELPITPNEFEKQLLKLYEELFPQSQFLPGAERLLMHLKENNIPIALATSSSKDSFELKTKKLTDVFNLFHHRVLGGSDPDVKKGKPNPDIFLVAADRFPDKPDPSKCLVFEDAPNGVEAGISAGMQVVMVPDPNLPKRFTEKATMVINSLIDFKPEEFGLPPFKN